MQYKWKIIKKSYNNNKEKVNVDVRKWTRRKLFIFTKYVSKKKNVSFLREPRAFAISKKFTYDYYFITRSSS